MARKTFGWGTALAVLVIAFGVFGFWPRTEAQQAPTHAAAGPKYTVVDTEGSNLVVVDNTTNTLYFYTEDPGKEVGDDLRLRGSIDLNEVGKPVIKPKTATK
jgi:hypothetical protein